MSKFLENLHARLVAELKRVGPQTIAAKTGVSRATIYNWMDKGNMPLDKLPLLQSAGVDVDYVLAGELAPTTGEPASAVSAADRALLRDFYAAPTQVQLGVKTTLGAFASSACPAGKCNRTA